MSDAETQAAVLDFLADPATHGGTPPERIETHISVVFLAGDRAWKIKKAIALPFLDFTGLEAREKFCRRELELNRRTAPAIYLDIHPITRGADGALAIGGAGETVDWVIEMLRFDGDAIFDQLSEAGPLNRRVMERLAHNIALFHMDAEVMGAPFGGREGLANTVAGNDMVLGPNAALFGGTKTVDFRSRAEAAIDKLGDRLDTRRADGLVRRCHGDMHLRNIVLVDDEPVLFDAIEFSDDFACTDVLYDLAFLLMDLDFRGQSEAMSVVFNRYMDVTGDTGGIAALPVMLAIRASVRALVGAAAHGQLPPEKQQPVAEEARAYLDRALAYLEPPTPRMIAVGGLSGSGKSKLARGLAPALAMAPGALVIRTDATRKRLAGVGPLDRLPEDAYSAEMTRRTYEAVHDTARQVLADGHPVIVDGVNAKPEQRQALAAIAAEAGVPFDGLWVEAPVEVMRGRIEARVDNVSDADTKVLDMQLQYDLGDMDWTPIDSSGKRKKTLKSALDRLGLK